MKRKMSRHPELLIPASSLEVLKTAVIFGADAVYIGGEAFGLRAKAKNFSTEEMRTEEHVLIRAAGNMRSWKKKDRESTFLFMKMKEELTFLTQKTCV